MNRYKDGRFTVYTTKNGLSSNLVQSIYEDKGGNLWIGTGGGLNRYNDGKFTTYTTKDGLSKNSVLSLYEDQQGSLWIGTRGGGLNRFKDGKFTIFTREHGLFDDVAFEILEDDSDNLWMSCNKGIFRVSKHQLNDFADGRIGSITPVPYGVTAVLRRNDCNESSPAGFKTQDGKLR